MYSSIVKEVPTQSAEKINFMTTQKLNYTCAQQYVHLKQVELFVNF